VRDAFLRAGGVQHSAQASARDSRGTGAQMKDSPTTHDAQASSPAGGDGKSNGNGAPHASAESHGNEEAIPKDLPRVSTPVVEGVILVFPLLLAALFAIGYFPHQNRAKEAEEMASSSDDRPRVDVTAPRRPTSAADLVLPADVRALQETSLFPRANGYLKKLL